MNRILVATDGSEGADRAIDYASSQAKAEGAELLIVHVIAGSGVPDDVFGAFTRSQQAWLQERLSSLSAEILKRARDRARAAGVAAIHLESRSGDVASTIIAIAGEKEVQTIVVGKRGAGRIEALLLGSVSQKLVVP
jgi:nucleotide-binding universal stress UspA family protein